VNVLFAVAIARQLGVGAKALAEALAAAPVLPMRWQRTHIGGLLVINDAYNANPLSMRAALEAFGAEPVVGRRWLVLGTMRELGTRTEDEHRAIGRALTPGPWAGLIAVGEGGRAIARGAEDAGWPANRTVMAADADAAARAIAERGTTGDAVLLKASRGEHFEDVEFALRGKLETVDQSPAGTRLNTNGQMRTA
jgi:UDP-N-acetylmuramyl pentapeptide synthase